jgi:hypothetical protein
VFRPLGSVRICYFLSNTPQERHVMLHQHRRAHEYHVTPSHITRRKHASSAIRVANNKRIVSRWAVQSTGFMLGCMLFLHSLTQHHFHHPFRNLTSTLLYCVFPHRSIPKYMHAHTLLNNPPPLICHFSIRPRTLQAGMWCAHATTEDANMSCFDTRKCHAGLKRAGVQG